MRAERTFPVMGTTAHVVVLGEHATALAAQAQARLEALEHRWSRFLPDSELSRVNACAPSPVFVSSETALLVQRSIDGWRLSHGAFDPTVLPAVENAGYDRDFTEALSVAAARRPAAATPAPGCAALEVDAAIPAVRLPPGVRLDPGGIGKGLAADIVSEELLASGARGALVNVGGDLCARGSGPESRGWEIALEDPARPGVECWRFAIAEGGVATSSRIKRRWCTRAGPAHHLIDPRTGAPSRSRHATVTAIASEAWRAEVAAKAALVDGLDVDDGAHLGAHLLAVDDQGVISFSRGIAAAT